MRSKTNQKISLVARGWLYATVLLTCIPGQCFASDVQSSDPSSDGGFKFDSGFLKGHNNSLSLDQYKFGNHVEPGLYRVDIYLNHTSIGKQDIQFIRSEKSLNKVDACLTPRQIARLGIAQSSLQVDVRKAVDLNLENKSGGGSTLNDKEHCFAIHQVVEQSKAEFDDGELRLDITIPQAFLESDARGYVSLGQLDYGIDGALLNYNFNSFLASGIGGSTQSAYLGLNSGVNFGPWRVRSNGAFISGNGSRPSYQESDFYVNRDITSIHSQLMIGDSYTDGQLFDSFKMRGISLASDDRMLPESMRQYAPVIRGVAATNAKVEIKQNNLLIKSVTVPPGPFEIRDLYATGFGTDLVVVVTESDGSQHSFTVPFTAAPLLLREGISRFNFNVGEYSLSRFHREMIELTYQRGMTNYLTFGSGIFSMNHYFSLLGAVGLNTEFGGFQLSYTGAQFQPVENIRHVGSSWSGTWIKSLQSTRTNFSLAAYRYNTQNFYSPGEAVNELDRLQGGVVTQSVFQQLKTKSLFSLSQNIGQGYVVNGSFTTQNYWNMNQKDSSIQLTASKNFGNVIASLNILKTTSSLGTPKSNMVSLSLYVPLDALTYRNSLINSTFVNSSGTGNTSQVNYSATTGDRGDFSYNLSAIEQQTSNILSAAATNRGNIANTSATISKGTDGSSHVSLSAQGGIIFHHGVATFAPIVGETTAIVHIDGAPEGLHLLGDYASATDRLGNIVLPFLSPYTFNDVLIDPVGTPASLVLHSTNERIAPHAKSIGYVEFNKLSGYALLIKANLSSGEDLPFAAEVADENGALAGYVGQSGVIEAHVLNKVGELQIKWGAEKTRRCKITYKLSDEQVNSNSFIRMNGLCITDQAVSSVNFSATTSVSNVEFEAR